MRLLLRIAIILTAGLSCASALTAEPLPRSVLVLDQSIPHTAYFNELFGAFQSTLNAGVDTPINVYSEKLEYSHFSGYGFDQLMRDFIKAKYREKRIGIIVAIGSDALRFALILRTDLGARLPIVFANVNERTAAQLNFGPDVTGTTVQTTFRDVVTAAKALVPSLKKIALVGDPFKQQTYRRHYQQEIDSFAGDLEYIDLSGLKMAELRRRVAALPMDAAVFYSTMSVDGSGTRYDPNGALTLIAQVANRPIVIDQETRLGYGGIGGFVLAPAPIGETTARLVLRLFKGESPSDIPITLGEFVKPVFDWRELKRWRISESNLPSGNEIRFREFDIWQHIIPLAIALVGQALLIAGLLHERRRRQDAEMESRQRVVELTRMNRHAVAGEMSATIAHEVNQPLTAILSNAESLHDLLGRERLDLEKIREIVADIIEEDTRASEVIDRIRRLLRKDESKSEIVDLNQLVESTIRSSARRFGQANDQRRDCFGRRLAGDCRRSGAVAAGAAQSAHQRDGCGRLENSIPADDQNLDARQWKSRRGRHRRLRARDRSRQSAATF